MTLIEASAELPGYAANYPGGLPVLDAGWMDVPPEDRLARMQAADIGPDVRWLFQSVRRQTGHNHDGAINDGMYLAYAQPRGLTYRQIGSIAAEARERGTDPCLVFRECFDIRGTHASVRDKYPDETPEQYADYISDEVLTRPRRPQDEGRYLSSYDDYDIPGSRFSVDFSGHDSPLVAMGRIRRGDLGGGMRTINNSAYHIMRWGEALNFATDASLDRYHTPHFSLAVEALAAAYGSQADEVLVHYAPALLRSSLSWLEGIDHLKNVPANQGGAFKRVRIFPERNGRRLRGFRNYSDAIINIDEFYRGVRDEGVLEDIETLERSAQGLTGEARIRRMEYTMRCILAACETKKDFQPSTQSSDFLTLENLRTIDLAPVMLQALIAHKFALTAKALRLRRQDGDEPMAEYLEGWAQELKELVGTMWVDKSDTEGYLSDLDKDGKPTGAYDLTCCYPLFVPGMVPYDRQVKMASTFVNHLARPYGYLISPATTGQQWDGDPDKVDAHGNIIEFGDNRGWPGDIMLAGEAFLTAAIEAQKAGRDPEPLIQAAEVALRVVPGIAISLEELKHFKEKLNVVRPAKFVNGGEYGRTEDEEQKGFGLTIAAQRSLAGRDFRHEVANPQDSWRDFAFARVSSGLLVASNERFSRRRRR